MDFPNGYDLPDWPYVNKGTWKTNVALKSLCEKYHNFTVVEASKAEIHLHTSHGMHLNCRVKNWLSEKTCDAVKTSGSKPEPNASLTSTRE